jgi:hypothetical protein
MANKQAVKCYLSESDREKLESYAKNTNTSKSEILRMAFQRYAFQVTIMQAAVKDADRRARK